MERTETDSTDEIEITDDMVEAGYQASCLYDREDPKEWEIAAIYRAMESVRRKIKERDRH